MIDATRPGDVVALGFFAEGKHLVIDAVVTIVYRNLFIYRVAYIPGYAAKHAEDLKLLADKTSAEPIAFIHGGTHVLTPLRSKMVDASAPMPSPSLRRWRLLPQRRAGGPPSRTVPMRPLPLRWPLCGSDVGNNACYHGCTSPSPSMS